MKMAWIRKYGKVTLIIDINRNGGIHSRDHDDSGKKTRKRSIIAWSEPAKEESIVSRSFPKRFSIRPRP